MALSCPNIDPVALAVGPLEIRWYALAYLAGFLFGWGYGIYISRLSPGNRPNREDIDDFIPWVILGVILGGRLGYILFYQSAFYLENPIEVFMVWHGGMAFHGGIVGVVASLVFYAHRRKIPLLRLCDIAGCAAPIGICLGRITNFINGELYGRVSDVPWAVVFPRGGDLPRHPSQIYQAGLEGFLLFLILLALLHVKAVRERPGILSAVFLIGYGVLRSIGELFREPDAHLGFILEGITMGQVLSVPVILFGIGVLYFAFKKKEVSS
ncbi:MAG: prolipoprotein diacylglyceryl transferase [Alphaproteobacteria bacterium]